MTQTTQLPSSHWSAIAAMTSYVARWPLRHIYGGPWLRSRFAASLDRVGSRTISGTYGLSFRDSETPPAINDLVLVTMMQILILLALGLQWWWIWAMTEDWIVAAIFPFSAFFAVPSDEDFLTEGPMEERVPRWLKPITSAFSFIATLPAMMIAIPAVLLWGLLGMAKSNTVKGGTA